MVPEDLLTSPANTDASFLDFTPDVESAEEDTVQYFGLVKALGRGEERTAVVRTLKRCDVACSTEECQGLERLREGELVQVRYHRSGDLQGQTFVVHAAAECTPMESYCKSHTRSRAASRSRSQASSPTGT